MACMSFALRFEADGTASDFHCTCPSDGYPCKHIGMILNAIPEYVAEQKTEISDEFSSAKLIAKVPEKNCAL